MKKLLIILGIIGILFASIPLPVFASEVPTNILESEPDPTVLATYPYYAHFYTFFDSSATGINDVIKDLWIYSDAPVLYLDYTDPGNNVSVGYHDELYSGALYLNGTLLTLGYYENMFDLSAHLVSSYTKSEFMAGFDLGYWQSTYDFYGDPLETEMYFLSSNMTDIYDYRTTTMLEDAISFAEPIEENQYGYVNIIDVSSATYSIQDHTWTTHEQSPVITFRYLYEPTQYGYTTNDWNFDIERDPNLWLGGGYTRTMTPSQLFPGMYEVTEKRKIMDLPIGLTEVQAFLYTDDNELYYSSPLHLINRVAFIDTNNDGIDDNTGLIDPGTNLDQPLEDIGIGQIPDRTHYDEGLLGTIAYTLDIVKYYITIPFIWLAESLNDLTSWLADSMGWISNLSAFFNAIFGFLPQEFTALIYIMLLTTTIFAVLKMMRG